MDAPVPMNPHRRRKATLETNPHCFPRVLAVAVSAIVATATQATPSLAQSATALTPNMRGVQLSADLLGRFSFSADSLTSGATLRSGNVAAFGVGWGLSERWSTHLTLAIAQLPRLDGTSWAFAHIDLNARYSFKAIRIARSALVPFVQAGGARRSLTDQEADRWMEGWSSTAGAGGQLFVTPRVAITATAVYSQGRFLWYYEGGSPTRDIRDPARERMVTLGVAYHVGRYSNRFGR